MTNQMLFTCEVHVLRRHVGSNQRDDDNDDHNRSPFQYSGMSPFYLNIYTILVMEMWKTCIENYP